MVLMLVGVQDIRALCVEQPGHTGHQALLVRAIDQENGALSDAAPVVAIFEVIVSRLPDLATPAAMPLLDRPASPPRRISVAQSHQRQQSGDAP